MSELDTFTLFPLRIDPQTKLVSSAGSSLTSADPAAREVAAELERLNQLHRAIVGMDSPAAGGGAAGAAAAAAGALAGVPPPPIPVHPKRSANVTKLRDSGNAEFRKGRYADAIRFYSLGLQMALTRPLWEPPQLVHEEVATLYANRAQAYMALAAQQPPPQQTPPGGWPEGAVDAEASVFAKKMGNAKAWWRRGKCLLEMGRLEEALEWVRSGLEMEGEEADLLALRKEIQTRLAKAEEAI